MSGALRTDDFDINGRYTYAVIILVTVLPGLEIALVDLWARINN